MWALCPAMTQEGYIPGDDEIETHCLSPVMPAPVAGIHVLAVVQIRRRGWHRKSGLPDFRINDLGASRVNPTCGDKPGHDE